MLAPTLRPSLLILLAMLSMTVGCRSVPQHAASGEFVERQASVAGHPHRYRVFVPAAEEWV